MTSMPAAAVNAATVVSTVRPGASWAFRGRIVTPWVGGGEAGHLLVLDVDDTGTTVTGRFVGENAFMTLTGHHDPAWARPGDERTDRDSTVDHAELDNPALLPVLGVVLPDVRVATHPDDAGHLRAQAWGPDGTCAVAVSDPDGDHPAWTWGPHDLWARVEDAVAWWHTTGRPGPRDLLYTATPAARTRTRTKRGRGGRGRLWRCVAGCAEGRVRAV